MGRIGIIGILLATAAASAGEANARTAVVIGLTGTSIPPEAERDPGTDTPATFKVHDLSRRWVEHRMQNELLETTQQAPASLPSVPLGPPAVVIPGWMQPGPSVGTWNASAACGSATYRPSGLLGYAGEARRRSIYDQVHAVACAHGLATDLFDALIIQESRYQPNAISSKQAYGYAQLMPDTARGLGVDRFDPFDNLRGGARYLRAQLDRFGVVDLALSAYNAGPGRVRDRVPEIAETRDYVARVLRNWQWLRGLRPSIPGEPHLMTLDAPPPGRTAAMLSF